MNARDTRRRLESRAGQVAWQGISLAVANSRVPPERAQSTALYLLVTGCNLPGALAAEVVGCTKQNVSQLLAAVEDRRELPEYDAELGRLERMIFGE